MRKLCKQSRRYVERRAKNSSVTFGVKFEFEEEDVYGLADGQVGSGEEVRRGHSIGLAWNERGSRERRLRSEECNSPVDELF